MDTPSMSDRKDEAMSERITEEQIKTLLELLDKSTPGKWTAEANPWGDLTVRAPHPDQGCVMEVVTGVGGFRKGENYEDHTEEKANAKLIAEAHNALPALLDEIERLRAVVGKLPVSADGVPVAPGMKVWFVTSEGYVDPYVAVGCDGGGIMTYPDKPASETDVDEDLDIISPTRCFVAIEAAREAIPRILQQVKADKKVLDELLRKHAAAEAAGRGGAG